MSENTEKPRGGAPKNNLNSFRTGVRMGRRNFVLADLGGKYITIGQHLRRLRTALETQVLVTHGAVSLAHQDQISVAIRHEQVALLASKLIRDEKSTDPLGDAKTAAHASLQRSLAIKKLHLSDDKPASEWDVIDQMGLESLQDGQECDPDEDTDLDTPGDCEAANSRQGDAEGRGSIWDEIDRLIEGGDDDGGDPDTQGAD